MSQKNNNFVKTKNFILDLLFPKYCVGCGVEGEWICQNCTNQIIKIKTPTCPICQRITTNGKLCIKCRRKSNLTGVMVAAYYKEGPLKEAIHTFKYEGVFDLASDLANLLDNNPNLKTFTKCNKVRVVLVAVPLHKKKRAQRGFNQSELLVKYLSKVHKLKSNSDLIRIKYTKNNQVELSGKARRQNMVGCFAWQGDKDELNKKIVLLVDDIYTTGSTLEECAKVLRRDAGVKEVWGLVLAKA